MSMLPINVTPDRTEKSASLIYKAAVLKFLSKGENVSEILRAVNIWWASYIDYEIRPFYFDARTISEKKYYKLFSINLLSCLLD